jgi:hypothetical protein
VIGAASLLAAGQHDGGDLLWDATRAVMFLGILAWIGISMYRGGRFLGLLARDKIVWHDEQIWGQLRETLDKLEKTMADLKDVQRVEMKNSTDQYAATAQTLAELYREMKALREELRAKGRPRKSGDAGDQR